MSSASTAGTNAKVVGSSPKSVWRDDPRVPNQITVHKTERLDGVVVAPPSKSYSHRALMVAGLCGGREVFVDNPLSAKDIEAFARASVCFRFRSN
jgi:hypothetical protein